ncbi:MAG: hypothetical protein AAF744_03240 [Pseudomonadota bacterium]
MSSRFIALIAAASVALTAFSAAPAKADDEDVARALAAILGVAIIGKVISDRKKKDDRKVTRVVPDRPMEPKPLPRRVKRDRKLLPGHCLRRFESRRGVYRGFGERCLRNNYRFAHRLPQHCTVELRGRNGPRYIYEARCLRNAGYRLARG